MVISTVGELLVEFVSHDMGCNLSKVADYSGPYPSGAPAIFIEQAAKVGAKTKIIGAVGEDAFGESLKARLSASGVDISGIQTDAERTTGTAFVSYFEDGSRTFIFHLNHSAASSIGVVPVPESEEIFHISGASLSSPALRSLIESYAMKVLEVGGQISFDPNIRSEFIGDVGYLDSVRRLFDLSAYVMPSKEDLEYLMPDQSYDDSMTQLLSDGKVAVAFKLGMDGAIVADQKNRLIIAPHHVEQIDPTGAGDCFCGTFIGLLQQGFALEEAGNYANTSGAMHVTQRGPMEWNPTQDEMVRFLSSQAMPNISQLVNRNRSGEVVGLPSFCTSNEAVLKFILSYAAKRNLPVLIEATCNQSNQFGGYTGMKPESFTQMVKSICEEVSLPLDQLILGGDHLGPNPWRTETVEIAMGHACKLVESYVKAGFTKIHLDASMAIGGEDTPSFKTVSERAAKLCQVAEKNAPNPELLCYVIGTEVPVPGGETNDMAGIQVTTKEDFERTISTHREAFTKQGLEDAFEKVVSIVVQPGVDFSNSHIMHYEPSQAQHLAPGIMAYSGITFEAHSTDYQRVESLTSLVSDRFMFLKVGPELTFAYREAILDMASLEEYLKPESPSKIVLKLLQAMDEKPEYWKGYYEGTEVEVGQQKLFSLSDRVRYYWPTKEVQSSLEMLESNLSQVIASHGLLSQFLSLPDNDDVQNVADLFLSKRLAPVLDKYYVACGFNTEQ